MEGSGDSDVASQKSSDGSQELDPGDALQCASCRGPWLVQRAQPGEYRLEFTTRQNLHGFDADGEPGCEVWRVGLELPDVRAAADANLTRGPFRHPDQPGACEFLDVCRRAIEIEGVDVLVQKRKISNQDLGDSRAPVGDGRKSNACGPVANEQCSLGRKDCLQQMRAVAVFRPKVALEDGSRRIGLRLLHEAMLCRCNLNRSGHLGDRWSSRARRCILCASYKPLVVSAIALS